MVIDERELRDFAVNAASVTQHVKDSYSHNMTSDTLRMLDLHIRDAKRFLDRIRAEGIDIHG